MMTRALTLLIGLFLSGCGSLYLTDDVDLTFDFHPLVGPSDDLHSPYVKGAKFNLFVHESQQSRVRPSWRIASEHPGILAVTDVRVEEYESSGERRRYLSARAAAVGEGATHVVVLDDGGEVVHRAPVEVLRPDRIDLLAHGPLLVRRPPAQALTTEAQVLRGGTATFLARYYRGGRQLSGNGVLGAMVPAGANPPPVTARIVKSFLFEDRDWLQVTAARDGQGPMPPTTVDVQLLADGEPAGRVRVIAVDEAAIARVALSAEEARGAENGQWLVVLAEAFDAQGRPVYGVTYTWNFGGKPEQGLGDLYRYEYEEGMHKLLTATHGGMSAGAMIEARKGFVSSTNRIGCAVASPRTPTIGPLLLLLLCAAALGRVRAR
jgi:hypothetical protein